MNKLLAGITLLVAVIFMLMGLRWLVDPSGAAEGLGMPLLEGLARSTQIGDLASFFVGGSVMTLMGLKTKQASWFQAAALLLGLTAVFRTFTWLFHDAPFAAELIAAEVVFCTILLLAASHLTTGHKNKVLD